MNVLRTAMAAVWLLGLAPGADAAAPAMPMKLPLTVGTWTRPATPRTIDARSIFKYMDGAGELYVAYRFDHLEVFDYASSRDGTILVELYWMQSSDDAFGLLSGDWGGERVRLEPGAAKPGADPPGAFSRALYGAGLLRVWSDNLYARVLASRETPASRQAVLDLGKALVRGRATPAPPRLMAAVPPGAGPTTTLRRDRQCFLRSYLVLNAAYYLASRDILSLGPSTEAVLAAYATGKPGPQPRTWYLLLVRYANEAAARAALATFLKGYLPEHHAATATPSPTGTAVVAIEGGHLGYRLSGRRVVFVFDAPDEARARLLLDQSSRNLETMERTR